VLDSHFLKKKEEIEFTNIKPTEIKTLKKKLVAKFGTQRSYSAKSKHL
jgi:hypothetical protein